MSFRPAFRGSLPLTVQDQIDGLCLQFEQVGQGQTPPRPEDFLPQIEEAYRPFLLRELVTLEITRRRMQGESPTVEEYRQRFPDLISCLDELLTPPRPGLPDSTVSLAATVVPSREALPVLPGYTFSGRQLGEGGMAVVWRARDDRLHRNVAIKALRSALVGQAAMVRRFDEEAQLTGQLQHPGIPPVHERGTLEDGRPYFCMKVVKGRTLGELLRERGGPSEDLPRFVQAFEQVCQAVGYAHSKGVIHRDLKPSNVMVGAFGEVQVMDWGLGKVLSRAGEGLQRKPEEPGPLVSVVETDRTRDEDSATQFGSVLGTYAYMPPEQALGEVDRVDQRSDVFGLGAILCEILTGHPPYQGAVAEMKARAQLGELGPAYERLRGCGADPALVSLAGRCLRKQPDERPADGGLVADELALYQAEVRERLQRAEIERATAESESRRVAAEASEEKMRITAQSEGRTRRLAWGLAAALAIGLAGTSYYFVSARLERDDAKATRAETEVRRKEAVALGEDLKRLNYAHQISLAQAEWQANNARNAWDHLESTDPSFRDWEYRYLCQLFNRNQTTLEEHAPNAVGLVVAFSPDGKYLASAGRHNLVKIWETATGNWVKNLPHALSVGCVAFSPNGKSLATGSASWQADKPGGQVTLWDARSLGNPRRLADLSTEVHCVAFDPESRLLAAGTGRLGITAGADRWGEPGEIRIWDVAAGQEHKPLKGHQAEVTGIAFGKDGRLASGSADGTVRIWDVVKGEQVGPALDARRAPETPSVLKGGGRRLVRNVAFSPDGRQLAAAYWDGTAKIWDSGTRQLAYCLEGHTNSVHNVAFSPDGKLLATASWDGTIKTWDTATRQEVRTYKGHRHWVLGLQFSPDGRRLATGSGDRTVKLWDVTKGQDEPALRGHTEQVTSVSFAPDGQKVASASADGTVRVWDPTTGQTLHDFTGHVGGVLAVAFSPDRRHLATGGGDHTVMIWDVATWRLLHTCRKHADVVNSVAFSPDGQHLASGSSDKTVMTWDVTTGKALHTLTPERDVVTSVAYSPDGRHLAAVFWGGTAMIWKLGEAPLGYTLEGHALRPHSVSFSADGKLLAAAYQDGTVKIWDAATRREVRTRIMNVVDVTAVCFHPDGRRLATADGDSNVKLWDMEAEPGRNVLILRGHTNRPVCLEFSRDGTRLASGGWDKTIRIWEAPLPEGGLADATSPAVSSPPEEPHKP